MAAVRCAAPVAVPRFPLAPTPIPTPCSSLLRPGLPLPRSDLFRYYHERLPTNFPFPPQPAWKAGDSPEHEPEDEGPPEGEAAGHIEHDDVIGEPVSCGCTCNRPAGLPGPAVLL